MQLTKMQVERISRLIDFEIKQNGRYAFYSKMTLSEEVLKKQISSGIYSFNTIICLAEKFNYSLDFIYFGVGMEKRKATRAEITRENKYKQMLINWQKQTKENGAAFADAQLNNEILNVIGGE